MPKSENELVSIVMPTYNSARYVAESIESILAQTYTDWELLVTDDASGDDTREIVRSYAARDPRIRLFTLQSNSGAGPARNNSICRAKGRYIAFCDSDDTWLPHKLERQMAFIKEKKCCLCFASYYECDAALRQTGVLIAPDSVSLTDTMRDDKIGFLTAMYDTRPFGKFYMPSLRKRQDWAYVLLILQKCKRAYALREPLACYRRSRGSISHNKFSLIKFNAKVYQTVFGYSKVRSYCYLFFLFIPHYLLKRFRKLINGRKWR